MPLHEKSSPLLYLPLAEEVRLQSCTTKLSKRSGRHRLCLSFRCEICMCSHTVHDLVSCAFCKSNARQLRGRPLLESGLCLPLSSSTPSRHEIYTHQCAPVHGWRKSTACAHQRLPMCCSCCFSTRHVTQTPLPVKFDVGTLRAFETNPAS